MFVPEARNDPTSSKTLILGSVQASGPPLLSAQAGGYVTLGIAGKGYVSDMTVFQKAVGV